jgi:hypothetical protein
MTAHSEKRYMQSFKQGVNMKKLFLLTVLASALPLGMQAQDDDLYFNPKKAVQESSVDNTPAYYVGSNRSVDEYNRRRRFSSNYQTIDSLSAGGTYGILPDSTYYDSSTYYNNGEAPWDDDYAYTRRMSRWDGYYDPWFYSYWGPYRFGWYSPWYGNGAWYAGWYDPWFDPWFEPWYYGYGYGWGWYSAYSPWYYGYGWSYPYYYGYYGGGYGRSYSWGNPSGLAGNRTWSYSRPGVSTGNNFGRTYGSAGSSTRTNSYTSRSASNRSFGSRTRTNTPTSTFDNAGFGNTRSSSSSFGSSSGSFGGSGFGGGHAGGGSRSGGGSFGGGRR